LAILAVSTLLAIGVSGQSNKNAGPDNKPSKQEQQTVHTSNGIQRQSYPQNNQTKASDNAPARNTTIEGTKVWWEDSNWWLVIIAACTGGVIGWQSWETRKSAQGAMEGAKFARQGIEITMLKEKANVRIEIEKLDVEKLGENWAAAVKIAIFNFGETKAFPINSHAALLVSPRADPPIENRGGPLITEPAIFPTTDEPLRKLRFALEVEHDTIWKLNTENAFAHVYGFIEYTDVFGGNHRTAFRYVWRANGWIFAAHTVLGDDPDGNKALYGGWEKSGSEEDNKAS